MNFNRAERIVWLEFDTIDEAKEFSNLWHSIKRDSNQRSPKHLNYESKKCEGIKK